MLAAIAEETAAHGVGGVTVATVVARARVSRRLFYENFADLEDCRLVALEWALAQARAVAEGPFAAEDDWLRAIGAALAALLRFFDEQPALAQLCIVHALAGGPRLLERREQTVGELCALVHRASRRSGRRPAPDPIVAESVVGGVLAILYARADTGRLIDLHGELMSMIALPYLGAGAAARELERATPQLVAARPQRTSP